LNVNIDQINKPV